MIDPGRFGITFSIKQCRNFGLNPQETLNWLINEAGFRRFRLTSYWNEHEPARDKYDFQELDWQIRAVAKAGGQISLCLGVKQPRWPESHWPKWASQLPKAERDGVLFRFIKQVIERYEAETAIV